MWIWKEDLKHWISGIECQISMLNKENLAYEKSKHYLDGKLFVLKKLLKKKSPIQRS
jgi:hypothetical protein